MVKDRVKRREEEDKEHPTKVNTDAKSLILGSAFNQSEAAVRNSELMEVSESHLTLFTDLCVEFVSPLRICRPQADMQGA